MAFPKGAVKVNHANEGSQFCNCLWKFQSQNWFDFFGVGKDARGSDDVTQPRCLQLTPMAFGWFDSEVMLFKLMEGCVNLFDMIVTVG